MTARTPKLLGSSSPRCTGSGTAYTRAREGSNDLRRVTRAETAKPAPLFVDLRDDGLYDVECGLGHRACTVLQNPRYELLLDSAALALRDDYHREAVVSFTAALEAFWGFYTRIVARHLGAPAETLEQFRKDSKLSERQIGAMYFAHLVLTNSRYEGDPEARRTFRNRVVHDGLFPTRQEAFDYAAYVYETIGDGLEQVRRLAGKSTDLEMAFDVWRGHNALRARGIRTAISTSTIMTILSHAHAGPRRPFAEAFRDWSDWNVWDTNKHFASEAEAIEEAKAR